MITMKRSLIEEETDFSGRNGGVQLLERSETRTRAFATEKTENESVDAERLRMKSNLNRLLNYDRIVEEPEVIEEVFEVAPEMATLEEDIRPTSTTLQFSGDGGEQLIQDLKVAQESNVMTGVKQSHKLSSKGKLVAVIYSLIVAVVLALIIVNTGILASLDATMVSANKDLAAAKQEYASVMDKVQSFDTDYINQWAEAEGFIKHN